MRRACLSIASVISITLIPLYLVWIGLRSIAAGHAWIVLPVMILGIPMSIAFAVVCDHVGEAMDEKRKSKDAAMDEDDDSPVKGTPWEADPGHTID